MGQSLICHFLVFAYFPPLFKSPFFQVSGPRDLTATSLLGSDVGWLVQCPATYPRGCPLIPITRRNCHLHSSGPIQLELNRVTPTRDVLRAGPLLACREPDGAMRPSLPPRSSRESTRMELATPGNCHQAFLPYSVHEPRRCLGNEPQVPTTLWRPGGVKR